MFALEELLQPIHANEPSGRSIRYEPITDQIREARVEEDDTLPMGDWGRQTKIADFALVKSLAAGALKKQSKDLWLAAWLGEASIQLEGVVAIAPALQLFLALQQEFWPSLFPEFEEGDVGLRAAPIQWAFDLYAGLMLSTHVAENGITYLQYKALQSGIEVAWGEGRLTKELLDASIDKSPRAFYAEAVDALAQGRETLQQLYLFCEERYGEDSPSFVKLRTVLEEVQHVLALLLALKPAPMPEPVPEPPAPEPVVEPAWEEAPAPMEEALPVPEVVPGAVAAPAPAIVATSAVATPAVAESPAPASYAALASWADVQRALEACALFCAAKAPHSEARAFFSLAQASIAKSVGADVPVSPSSEQRLELKRTCDNGDWSELLTLAVDALRTQPASPWLDAYRYLCTAAEMQGAIGLYRFALHQVRGWVQDDPSLMEATFDDETPLAGRDTREWLQQFIAEPEVEPEVVPEAQPPAEPEAAAVAEPAMPDALSARAEQLVAQGALQDAAQLLFDDPAALKSGRGGFLRKLEFCRLLVQGGHAGPAKGLLQQLVAEMDTHHLDTWEERELTGEVLALLMQTMQDEAEAESRRVLYARLCRLHPALAVSAQAWA